MAERMGLQSKDLVKLTLNGKSIEAPAWIQAGHPDNSVTVFLGYGRKKSGRAGTGAGFDMYPLRTANQWFTTGLALTKTGGMYQLASTQGYQTMETPDGGDRPLVRTRTLDEYRKEPDFAKEDTPPAELTLYPGYDYKKEPNSWGMTIDLNACVGLQQLHHCLPVRKQYCRTWAKSRLWSGGTCTGLRVDAYYQGDRDNPKAYFQPVPCMQCENAPCELVCPVGATTHSTEGLNDMVYNRCVGTRYCSNNCPYKVRRFNFLLFQDWETPQLKMMRNPDVTIRSRGGHGKVHLLRAAHQRASHRTRKLLEHRSKTAICRRPVSSPARQRHHFWKH